MKKGQAAMEFLMTYGWAILIVLIAIGALMYFIKPTDILPEKCVISTGSGLFCDKWSADGTSGSEQISLKIKNALNEQVTVTTASEISDGTNSCAVASDTVIAINDPGTIIFSSNGAVGTCAGLATSGAKIQADISLTFTDPDNFTKTTAGTLIVKVP